MNHLQKAYQLDHSLSCPHQKLPFPASIVCYALMKPIKLTEEFFRILSEECPDVTWLNRPVTSRGLTLLHVSVILGQYEAIKGLLEVGANPNASDKRGWTPLHHAALSHHFLISQLLLGHGAEDHLQTDIEATYINILNFTKEPEVDPKSGISLMYHDGKEVVPLTQKKFRQLTGATYLEESFFDSVKYLECWKNEPEKVNFPFKDKVIGEYRAYRKPSLYMKSLDSLDSLIGYGIFSAEEIAKGQIIGEYVGKVYQKELDRTGYTITGNKDGKEFRNEMAMVNDGFPNVTIFPVSGVKGQSERQVFFAINRIRPGDQLVWNYGPNHIKFDPRVELRPRELRDFIKLCDYEELSKLVFRMGTSQDITLDEFCRAEKFRYVVGTPSVLFTLIIDGSVSIDQGRRLFEIGRELFCLPSINCVDKLFEVSSKNRMINDRLVSLGLRRTAEHYLQTILELSEKKRLAEALSYAGFYVGWMEKLLIKYDYPDIQLLSPEERDDTFLTVLKNQIETNS